MKNFLYELLKNFRDIFIWPNIFWHLVMIVITYFCVATGFDWYYFSITRSIGREWWVLAGMLGFLVPVCLPLVLYLIGKFRANTKLINTAFAAGQAVFLGWFVSSLYKAFTGRIPPEFYSALTDISNGWRFGFWEGGIFWGWPSSHTTVAFALITTLIVLYPQNSKIKYLGLLYAAYIGLGASVGFHWFSEFISGIILGTLIGVVAGKSFKN